MLDPNVLPNLRPAVRGSLMTTEHAVLLIVACYAVAWLVGLLIAARLAARLEGGES